MHWKIQLCAHANLGEKLCNYFVQVTSNTLWKNCVNLLKSTVELYLFSLYITNIIPSKSFLHSMVQETHAQRIIRLLDAGINNRQIIHLSLGVRHQKRAHWKHWFSTVLFNIKCFGPALPVSI